MSTEINQSAVQKVISQKLDDLMKERGVPSETREAVTNSFGMMSEYIPYALKQRKDPSDGKVLAEFLATKGMYVAKYFGNNAVNCGIAIISLMKSGATAAEVSSSPGAVFLPAPVLAWGLAFLDLLDVANSCEFVSDATYHLFLKQSEAVIRRTEAIDRKTPAHSPSGRLQ